MNYTFDKPNLSFDGRCLAIKNYGRILKFTNIDDFSIEGSRVSFSGDYIPEKYEIICFKLKDNPIEHLGRFIEFTHDRTGIKVDFSFDKIVQSPCIEPICYSDVEIVTFTNITDNVQFDNIWASMGYIHNEEIGIIRKDLWIPKSGDIYYFIDNDMIILSAIFSDNITLHRDHIKIFNCFKTKEEAETIRDKFLKLLSER